MLQWDYTISTGVSQENGENTGKRFPVQEFDLPSAGSFRCSTARMSWTEKILQDLTCACTHAHTHTEAPGNFTPVPHQNTFAFQLQ